MNEIDQSPNPAPLTTADRLQALLIASEGYRHAEIIVQSRLYNFLVAASILFLSWATLFAGKDGREQRTVLVVIAGLGVILSILWAILGTRERKFLDVNMDIIRSLEEKLENKEFIVTKPISDLQDGKIVHLSTKKRSVQLNYAELMLKSRNLLVLAPLAFSVTFLFLMMISQL